MRATRMALHTQWRVWSESLWALMRASYTPRVEHCELIWCNIAQLASGMTVAQLCRLLQIYSVEIRNELLWEEIAISQSLWYSFRYDRVQLNIFSQMNHAARSGPTTKIGVCLKGERTQKDAKERERTANGHKWTRKNGERLQIKIAKII